MPRFLPYGTIDINSTGSLDPSPTASNFLPDSGSFAGSPGLVPAPAAGDGSAGKLLCADGTWKSPAAVSLPRETALLVDGKGLWWDSANSRYKHMYASPRSAVCDIRDFMDARYNVGSWITRTATPGTGTDMGPAWQDAAVELRSRYGYGKILIPPVGNFAVATPPAQGLLGGIMTEGQSASHVAIVYRTASGILFNYTKPAGTGNALSPGGGARNLAIWLESGMGDSTAGAVSLQGDNTSQPDETIWEELYITATGGTSYWQNVFNINGTLADGTVHPQGIRVGRMTNVSLFAGRNFGLGVYNAVEWTFDNVGCYSPKTSTGGSDILIGGGGTTLTNTTQCSFRNIVSSGGAGGTEGNLSLQNGLNVSILGYVVRAVAASTTFNQYFMFGDASVAMSGALGATGQHWPM